jgi:hypothetical protein
MEAAVGCGWWDTDTAALLLSMITVGPVGAAFAAIARLLKEGADSDVIVGTTTATAAFKVAQEWIDSGVPPEEVGGWLRTGCWNPTTARAMADAGLRPWRLLDDTGAPQHWVEVDTPDSQCLPLARAVAEEFVTVDMAVARVTRRRAS